jgi:chemotaxis signal transduction protein
MSQYLQVKVADVHVLLPTLHVHEVMRLDDLLTQGTAHVDWRNRVIALMDLGQVLGRTATALKRHYGVVYSSTENADDPPVMLQVDEVLGLREPKAQDWRPLPDIQTRAQLLLDAVWVESAHDRHSYRMRHPTSLDSGAAGADGSGEPTRQ